MSVSIQITDEQLQKSGVAKALAQLLYALSNEAVVAAPAPVAVPAPAPAPVEAKTPVASEAPAPKVPRKRGRPRKNPVAAPTASPKKEKKAQPVATAQAPKKNKGNSIGDLQSLLDQVSENSKQFMHLLKEHKQLSMEQAMKLLELDEQKAVGGVVGGISRKARKFGLYPPFSKGKTDQGERFWVWTGEVNKPSAPVVSTKKKRGPGRPRKNPVSNQKSTTKKRGPGRPRKNA